jgi:uncharacterized membrane protein SirB2
MFKQYDNRLLREQVNYLDDEHTYINKSLQYRDILSDLLQDDQEGQERTTPINGTAVCPTTTRKQHDCLLPHAQTPAHDPGPGQPAALPLPLELALAGSGRLQQKWLKVLPHINDTFLLLFGVLLAVTLQMSPGQQPWLMAKLIALVIYIGLGVMALKRPARGQKLVAGVAALAVFGYMIGAAITKSAWSWVA